MCPRVNPKAWWPVASEGNQNSLSFHPLLPVLHLSFSTHKWLSPSPLLTAIPHSFSLRRIAQRTTLGGRRSFDCWLSKAIITAASAGYENDFLSVKPVSLPGWPWWRWNRKRQTNAFASQPTRLKQNKVNNTQQWKDKWWKHLPSLPGREHFTWKQPPEQDLIFAVAVLMGFSRGADVWWAPAVMHSTRNPAAGMSFL